MIKSNGRVCMKTLSYRLDNKTFVRTFFWGGGVYFVSIDRKMSLDICSYRWCSEFVTKL